MMILFIIIAYLILMGVYLHQLSSWIQYDNKRSISFLSLLVSLSVLSIVIMNIILKLGDYFNISLYSDNWILVLFLFGIPNLLFYVWMTFKTAGSSK